MLFWCAGPDRRRKATMLTLYSKSRYSGCGRLSRRNFLKVGSLGFGAFGFSDLLAERAAARAAGKTPKDASVVWLWLQGVLSHHELFDLKVDIPSEYRSVAGDFDRTPKINHVGGRDDRHYVSTLALAGGGLKMGQVIGAADKIGAYPTTKPIHPQDLMATFFHVLGMDLETQVVDFSG